MNFRIFIMEINLKQASPRSTLLFAVAEGGEYP